MTKHVTFSQSYDKYLIFFLSSIFIDCAVGRLIASLYRVSAVLSNREETHIENDIFLKPLIIPVSSKACLLNRLYSYLHSTFIFRVNKGENSILIGKNTDEFQPCHLLEKIGHLTCHFMPESENGISISRVC